MTSSSNALAKHRRSTRRELGASVNKTRLRVLFVTSQDSGGGAPRAIHRIYQALRQHHSDEIDVSMRVIHKSFADEHIIGGKPARSKKEYAEYFLRTRFRKYFPRKPFISDNILLHSQARYDSGLAREINSIKPQVIMLGWLGNSTLSIEEIGRLKAPVVWRLSDMWMYFGAEHYTEHDRYSVGYARASRPTTESGPDIDRETFRRKLRHGKAPQNVICPSQWMANEVGKSTLTKDWPVYVIPNAIDLDIWRPVPRSHARRALGLPARGKVILFGAGSGLKDHHKGGDLLLQAMTEVYQSGIYRGENTLLTIFGQEGESFRIGGIQVSFLGKLDDRALRNAYSASDVMVVPSRPDNFPSTAVEAQACGTPVVAFRTAGLPDIVQDGATGFLADPFDTCQLASLIGTVLGDASLERRLGTAARARAQAEWSPQTVANQYLDVFREAVQEKNPR
ncbi:MAG: D-inositol 3-phosphate glycosyltransferase [Cellulomonadaceae bacterium TMED98]|nr:MAG: D-inositol 3-phosphate glycosyltransferase [Cellulomonadaceae bacterium TMED98]